MELNEILTKYLPVLNTFLMLMTVVMLITTLCIRITTRRKIEKHEKKKDIALVRRNDSIDNLKKQITYVNDEISVVINSIEFKSDVRKERNCAYSKLQELQRSKNDRIYLLQNGYGVYNQEEEGIYDGYRITKRTIVSYENIKIIFDTLIDIDYSNSVINSLNRYGYTYIPMCLAKDMMAMSAVMGIPINKEESTCKS